MKCKRFPAPFFNHFIQNSPTIAKLQSLHGALRVSFPHKNGPIPLWLAPPSPFDNFKSPCPNVYALPSPINMTTMIRQNTKFPSIARSSRQTWSPGYSPPHSYFAPLSRGSVTNPILITVFNTYLTPRSMGAWVWAKTLLILNVAP